MAKTFLDSLPRDKRKDIEATLATLNGLVFTTEDDYVYFRAGWTIEMVFHEGDTVPVRERAQKVIDLFCKTVGVDKLVYWHGGAPDYLTAARVQKRLAEDNKMAMEDPKHAMKVLHLGSGKPRPPERWIYNAHEYTLFCRIKDEAGIWIDEHRSPGAGPCMSFIRLGLPVSWVASQPPERNAGWLTSCMVELMQPFWCSAGWGIITNAEETSNQQQNLYPFLQRYPGLNAIGFLKLMDVTFNNAMHSINWLNYISDPLLDKLGGREHVREQIKNSKNNLGAKDVGNCLCIIAGEFPWLGDTTKGITLPGFGEAARLLKPIRISSYGYFFGDFAGNQLIAPPPYGLNDPQAWLLACDAYLSRFDDY